MSRYSLLASAIVGMAVLSGCPLPSIAGLRIPENAPHATLWRKIYDELPCCWKSERAIVVQELSVSEMVAFVRRNGGKASTSRTGSGSSVDGCYQKGNDTTSEAGTICLCVPADGPRAELVFAHEYAHFIWDERLTKANRAAFKRLWQRQKRAGHLITNYAAENVEEGFAEIVASFLRQAPVLFKHDADSYAFLCSLSGVEARLTDTTLDRCANSPCTAPTTK